MNTETNEILNPSADRVMRVADEVWVATALLHREHPDRPDFSVQEIKARARKEDWGQDLRIGFNQHVSHHCVGNKSADPANHRMLTEIERGRRRLYRVGDPCSADRVKGRIRPNKTDLPPRYHSLVDWYDEVYSRYSSPGGARWGGSALHTHGVAIVSVSSAGVLEIPEFLRQKLGICEGTRLSMEMKDNRLILQPVSEKFVDRVAGSYRGKASMVEARERDHRIER